MAPQPAIQPSSLSEIHEVIAGDAQQLSAKLLAHRKKLFPPEARKTLRRFSSGEAAKLIGINDGYLRQLSLDGKGPQPETSPTGRRSYSFEDIQALRVFLDEGGKAGQRTFERNAVPFARVGGSLICALKKVQ